MYPLKLFVASICLLGIYFPIVHSNENGRWNEVSEVRHSACVRRLSQSSEIGCGGDSSVLDKVVLLEDQDEVDNFLYKQTSGIVALPLNLFTIANIKSFKKVFLKGMILLSSNATVPNILKYNIDSTCPNDEVFSRITGLARICPETNPLGNALMFEDISFNVVLLNSERENDKVRQCLKQYAKHGCAALLTMDSYAVGNAVICTRRSRYANNEVLRDLMQFQSICNKYEANMPMASTRMPNSTFERKPKSVTLVIVQGSGYSMFSGMATGAVDPLLSVATATMLANLIFSNSELLKKLRNGDSEVVFAFTLGDSLNLMGAYSIANYLTNEGGLQIMKYSEAKLLLKHVKTVIEIGSLHGILSAKPHLIVAAPRAGDLQKPLIKDFRTSLSKNYTTVPIAPPMAGSWAPIYAKNADINVLYVGSRSPEGIASEFVSNPFYHGFMDTIDRYNDFDQTIDNVQPLVHSLAKTVCEELDVGASLCDFSSVTPKLPMEEISDCIVRNRSCDLVATWLPEGWDPELLNMAQDTDTFQVETFDQASIWMLLLHRITSVKVNVDLCVESNDYFLFKPRTLDDCYLGSTGFALSSPVDSEPSSAADAMPFWALGATSQSRVRLFAYDRPELGYVVFAIGLVCVVAMVVVLTWCRATLAPIDVLLDIFMTAEDGDSVEMRQEMPTMATEAVVAPAPSTNA